MKMFKSENLKYIVGGIEKLGDMESNLVDLLSWEMRAIIEEGDYEIVKPLIGSGNPAQRVLGLPDSNGNRSVMTFEEIQDIIKNSKLKKDIDLYGHWVGSCYSEYKEWKIRQ